MNPTTTTTHPAAQALTATTGTFTDNVSLADNDKLRLGASNDLDIYHDGSNSFIEETGTGDLRVKGSQVRILSDAINLTNAANSEDYITCAADGAVNLRYDGTSCLTTASGGAITVNNGITLSDGNLTVASGHGIDFSATGDPTQGSGTSELLDDYEEGTWTPTLLGSSSHPSITTSVAAGKFVRIGGLVFIQWNMIITNVASSGSGNAQVGGLPYAMVGNTYQGYIGIMYNDTHSNETQKGYIPNGAAYINLVPTGRTQTNLGLGTISTGYFGGGGSYTIV
jgi:hypothetical protein